VSVGGKLLTKSAELFESS